MRPRLQGARLVRGSEDRASWPDGHAAIDQREGMIINGQRLSRLKRRHATCDVVSGVDHISATKRRAAIAATVIRIRLREMT